MLTGMMLYAQTDHSVFHLKDTASIKKAIKGADAKRESMPDNAVMIYSSTLSASKKQNYNEGIIKSLTGLARCHTNKNEQEKALALCREALTWCGDDPIGHEMTASIYLLLSETHYYKSRYDSCAFYRYAALAELDNNKIPNPRMQIRIYCSILQFWLNAHDDIKNDVFIKQVVQRINGIEHSATAAKDSNLLVNIYFHKAGYYNNIGQNDSARYYCNRHLEFGQALNMPPSMRVATLLNMGITYLDDKRPVQAIEYIKKGIAEIPEQGKNLNRHLIYANFFLGEAYCQQQDYYKAIAITLPALQKADSLNIFQVTDRAYKTLAEAYDGSGQYKKAAEYRKKYAVIRDSLTRVQKLEMMYDLETKYRISDKDKELARRELAIARNETRIKTKNFWIGGIAGGTVLILLISLLLFRNNRHKQKLQEAEIGNLNQRMQISGLQAMIDGEEKERSRIARDLHDGLGGSLGAIRTLLSSIYRKHKTADVSSDFVEVIQMMEEASADLRKTAHNLMPEILLQEGLVKASKLFCERIRKGHSLEIRTEILGKIRRLPEELELAAYRIIQELLHNILKHSGATEAVVQIVFHESQLCITVEDNGQGLPADTWQNGKGIGLKTIKERVKLLNGQIDIASTSGQGASIYMEFNIAAPKLNTVEQ
jgi:signal transduction histidine kinase